MAGSVVLRSWTVELLRLDPLHAFVACEFEGKSLRTHDHGSDVHENVSVDCVSCEVEVFVCLDVEGRHQL